MNIFLSGKMDAEHGAWRDEILGREYSAASGRHRPRWEICRALSPDGGYDFDEFAALGFPREPNAFVLGIHSYIGPYRLTFEPEPDPSNVGYFHGSTVRGSHGDADGEDRKTLVFACLQAIGRSDLLFAYLNTPDCFGTLAEIGFARSLGEYVYVASHADAYWDDRDYWFVEEMANATGTTRHPLDDEGAAETGIADLLRDAIVRYAAWEGRTQRITALAPVSAPDLTVAIQSFAQIVRWSSDPRVRAEAERMVRRLSAG